MERAARGARVIRTAADSIIYARCPVCSHLPGACEHLSKKGRLRRIGKHESAQGQKYSKVWLWRR